MHLPSESPTRYVNWFVRRCIEVVFPQSCILCKKDIPKSLQTPICPLCFAQIPLRNHPPMSPGFPIDAFHAATEFSGQIRELIHAFKYQGKDYLAPVLVDIMTRNWPDSMRKYDAIIPVPAPYWRELKRGYNQSYLLAQELGTRLRVRVIKNWIKHKPFSLSQTKLSRKKRELNARSRFLIKFSPAYMPRHVLLIDDVCTTGATLRSCATLLKKQGVITVSAGAISQEI